MAADRDLDSSKAKSTSTQGGCSRERLKTAPLFLGGLPAEVGMEVDDESEPSSGDVLGSEEAHQCYAANERGLYTGQMLGLKFMVSIFLVHAEGGGPAPRPQQGGGLMGCLCCTGGAVVCVR